MTRGKVRSSHKPPMKISRLGLKLLALLSSAFVFFTDIQASVAGSATWSANPPTNIWHSAVNWIPTTVPNGPNDTATFQISNQTNITIGANTEVNAINFSGGGSGFSLTNNAGTVLTISGAGIQNNSGFVQSFIISGQLAFTNSAIVAGNFINISDGNNATITFSNSASAGSATLVTYNGSVLNFLGSATAATATVLHSAGADVNFYDSSTAGSAVFNTSGNSRTTFMDTSNAGSANFTL
jgi:fibronectin-binding autotransporter adhesin